MWFACGLRCCRYNGIDRSGRSLMLNVKNLTNERDFVAANAPALSSAIR
jgi:hypothetical protein